MDESPEEDHPIHAEHQEQEQPAEEEVSECDWVPPPDVEIVESEVFQIPSGLPSLEDFIRTEMEKEAAAAAVEVEISREQEEEDIQEVAEAKSDEGSVQEAVEDEAADLPTEEVKSDEEYEMPEPEAKPKQKPAKKAAAADDWLEMDMKIGFGGVTKEIESKEKEETKLMLEASTHNYINDLIGKVVELCEYEDPDEVLRKRLDKREVIRSLEETLLQLDIEQKMRLFLNRKTVEHFRRKKAMRPLTDDSPEMIVAEMRKYRAGLFTLNENRGREEALEAIFEQKVSELKKERNELVGEAKALAGELELLARKTYSPDGSERMDALIDLLMAKMRHMRREISNVRFALIQRQHTMAAIQEKAKKLEDLGNGLRMINYEHLQTETQALGKKIEDRNNELNRLHARYNADIHNLAHVCEKQQMVRNTIAVQEEAFEELVEEKQLCREGLNRLKLERASIRKEFQKLSFQNGLLDKPDLLLDYDATKEKADNLRAKNNEMKAAQAVVEGKLKNMMKLLQ